MKKDKILLSAIIIIGIGAIVKLLLWNRKGNTFTSKESSIQGDASSGDVVGQKYYLTTPYAAINEKTKGFNEFIAGAVFVKNIINNDASVNEQDSIIVAEAKLGKNQYIIPISILKKM